jgi:acetyltransferase-like isoleucine patch superfamily enzyme
MANSYVDSTARVSSDAEIGVGSKVWMNAQVREGARIGRDCVLSKGVYVGVGVQVGDGSKVQNYVSIFEGVNLGECVFCGPHMTFTNDPDIRISPSEYEPSTTEVGNWASFGAHSTILPGLSIGSYSIIGAHSLVTKDVPDHALVFGNPARIRGVVCYCGEKISSLDGAPEESEYHCESCGEEVNINLTEYSNFS